LKVTMVIPSYWARESKVGWKEGDAICEGTLLRVINSIKVLNDKDFQLVIIVAPTSEDIETQVEKKVANIIKLALTNIGAKKKHPIKRKRQSKLG